MTKKCGVLFSGGKDSTYAMYLARKNEYKIRCLISVFSKNPFSYMFHTPNITLVKLQAEVMGLHLINEKTKGEKEKELEDLKKVIKKAKEKDGIDTIVTGALKSVYQASRIQKICDDLKLECFNPLWQKDEFEYLNELVENNFEVIVTGVFAEGLDKSWLGRKIDTDFIKDIKRLHKKYKIHPAGEGGEFETFVLDCPMFKKKLKIKNKKIVGEKNSWRLEIELE